MSEVLAVPTLLRQAGATMTTRSGRPVPAHYGSVAAELAVCTSSAGLAHRADLGVLSLVARRNSIDDLLARTLGHAVAVGGTALEGGVWWCRPPSEREIVIVGPHEQVDRLKWSLGHFSGGTLTDRTDTTLVLNVVGRRAQAVLADLGVYGPAGDPAAVAPFSDQVTGGRRTTWVHEDPTSAIALVDAERAETAWHAIMAAGRAHGMTYVGVDSIDRFRLAERLKARSHRLV